MKKSTLTFEEIKNIGNGKLEKEMTKESFLETFGIDSKEWDKAHNWSTNEYGTQDFKVDVISKDDEEISLTAEVNDDEITHIYA